MKNRDSTPSYFQPGPPGIFSSTLRRSLLCGATVFLATLCISTFFRTNPIEIELEMSGDTGDLGEIFYAAPGESTSGERAVRFPLTPDYRRSRLRLPDGALSVLRLDPGSGPGSLLIRRMTVRQGEKELKLIDGPHLARLDAMKGIRREAATPDAVAFSATESDPFMVFAVPPRFSGMPPGQRALGWGFLSAMVFALVDLVLAARLRSRPGWAHTQKATHLIFSQRLRHSPWSWFTLAVAPVAGLLWARGHVLPTMMCLSLCLALASTALAGVLAQSWIEGLRAASTEPVRRPGLFQVLWLGQYAIFALAMLVTPVAGLFTDLTGIHVPYRVSLPLLVVVLAIITQRVARVRAASLAWPTAVSAPPAALVLLAVFRAMYMHSVHAGGLGHDTEQHIYWTQHIADYGFLPMAARGTDLLDDYPRFFHVLCAGWSALGLSPIVGPFVKIMPALQTTLACAFLCELVPPLLAGGAADRARDHPVLRVALGVFLAWHMTFGDGQQIYDGNDLSGTTRLAASWVLLGLPLLFLAHHAKTIRGASPWLVGLVPVLLVVGLGVNPVLVPVYLTYSVPVALMLAVLTRERATVRLPTRWWRHFALGTFVSVLLLLSNPFAWNKLSHTRVGASVLASMGMRTMIAGLPDPPPTTKPPALCETPLATCLFDLGGSAVEEGAQQFVASIRQADLPGFGSGNHAFVYWLMFTAPLFVAAFRRLAYPATVSQPSRRGAQTFLAILIASAIPALLYAVTKALLAKLVQQSSSFNLLNHYYASQQMFLGAWLRCLLPLSSWLLLPATSMRRGLTIIGWLITATAGLVGLSNFQIGSLVAHRNAGFPWTIDWPELRALRHIDDFVPPHETVVVPAMYMLLNEREHLLMSTDPVGAAATELKSRTLFMIRLGTSLDYGWRELRERFCGASSEDRRSFLRTVNARWVLVRAESPKSEGQLDADFWHCGVTLRMLEAEYPPAWSERDLALYRINP